MLEVHYYVFFSVTEEEIHQGLDFKDNHNALCYIRDLDGINKELTRKKVQGFVDLADNDDNLDKIAQKLRSDLVHMKVPDKFLTDNVKKYTIAWDPCLSEGRVTEEFQEYLIEFSKDFETNMKRLIKNSDKAEFSESYCGQELFNIYTEVLHHAMFAQQKCEIFCGRRNVLQQIENYLKGKYGSYPLIVHGESGFGKTAFMAKTSLCVHEWLKEENKEAVTAVRFMGTSPESTNIQGLLKSLIIQICYVYCLELPREENFEKIGDLYREFQLTLSYASQASTDCALVIILDAADQLLNRYGAHQMAWLPKKLPPNVYIIVSMLSDR